MVYHQGGNDIKIHTSIPLFFVLTVLASGCVSVRYTMLGPGYPPVPESEVYVFSWEDELPEHTRIALLHFSPDRNITTTDKPGTLLAKLREQAGALGANGIVVAGVKELGDGMWVVTDTDRIVVQMDELDVVLPGGRATVDAIAIRVE